MNNGLYAACAGLLARTQALDLAANNLANVNTGGFKGQVPRFASLLAGAGTGRVSNAVFRAVDEFGVLGESRLDLQQGPIEQTGNDLDFAIQGSGYFALQNPQGGRLYTRNGAFHINRQSQLTTADGSLVLGSQGPILLPPGKLAVSAGGIISVDGAVAGQLQVVDFASGTDLTPQGAATFSAPAGAERPSNAVNVVQGALEGSNVDPVSAAVGLVVLQRNMGLLQQALTVFHSEMNRIAAQELSRL
ncbi:MAG: flagellar hook basal-body protein [Candidatus Korobacteraceae bacterium]